MTGEQLMVVAMLGTLLLIMLLMFVFFLSVFRPWLRSMLAGAGVSVIEILAMRLRGNPPGLLIDTLLALRYRGIEASIADVEKSYIANKGQVDQPARLAGIVEERRRNLNEAPLPREGD